MPPRKTVRTKPSGSLKRFADAKKYETRILGDIQRHLLGRPQNEGRDLAVLHASEMCYKSFCERAAYYRLTGVEGQKEDAPYFQIDVVWEEGHAIQRKWNDWINAMGVLRGTWRCVHCAHSWEATSPKRCPECGTPEPIYMEVILWSEKYGLSGHADGDIDEGTEDDPLLEVKSIGAGTLRKEVPHLLTKYSYKVELDNGDTRSVIDMDRLWRDIKRPFPSHLKQGMLYCFLAGRSTMIFIYEFKPTQAVKEFVIKFQPDLIKDILESALDIKYAVAKKRIPQRPSWADDATVDGCKTCAYRDRCWGTTSTQGESDESEEGRRPAARRGVARRQGSPGEAGATPGPKARVQRARGADQDHGTGRPEADEPVRSPHSLAGLLGRAVGPGGSRREVRRRPPEDS